MAQTAESPKMTNNERRASKLRAEIRKGHNWRVQVWAQQQVRIAAKNAELVEMGFDEEIVFEPNFEDPSMVEHYTTMSLDG